MATKNSLAKLIALGRVVPVVEKDPKSGLTMLKGWQRKSGKEFFACTTPVMLKHESHLSQIIDGAKKRAKKLR